MEKEIVTGTNSQVKIQRRVLIIIVDGYGFDPFKEKEILTRVVEILPEDIKKRRKSIITSK